VSEVKSDFSDRFVSAYNKFTLVSATSLFVSTLTLSKENSFFGFKVDKLDERWVETVFFVATIVLGWNYVTRVLDERKALNELDAELNAIAQNFGSRIANVSKKHDEMSKILGSVRKDIDVIREIVMHPAVNAANLQSGKYALTQEEIDNLMSNEAIAKLVLDKKSIFYETVGPTGAANHLNRIPEAMSKIEESIKNCITALGQDTPKILSMEKRIEIPRLRSKWPRIRFWTVEFMLPIFLFVSCSLAYLFPNTVFTPVEWLGDLLNFTSAQTHLS